NVLSLGPIPDAVLAVVRQLVAEARPDKRHTAERLNGYCLTGGLGGASYTPRSGNLFSFLFSSCDLPVENVLARTTVLAVELLFKTTSLRQNPDASAATLVAKKAGAPYW